MPKVPRKMIATFTPEQIDCILSTFNQDSSAGFRDYAIVLVFLDTGVRLSELVNLTVGDIDFDQS